MIIGIDIGGTKIAVATADRDGRIIASARMATEAEKGPQHTIPRMLELVRRVVGESGGVQPVAIGVGCGGPLDPATGVIISPPNLPGWDAIPLRQMLEDEFGLRAYVDNDANAAALGEHRFGAGVGTRNMVYITVSTGIGGGIIANGQLLHGVRAGAGEVGHQIILPNGPYCNCGSRGCLEALSSGTAIARRAREALAGERHSLMREMVGGAVEGINAEVVVAAAKERDPLALQIWCEAVDYLAIGVANVIVTLAPEMVIIGGGVASAGDLLFIPLRQSVAEHVCVVPMNRVKIVPAKLGPQVGVVGAVALALAAGAGC